MVFEPKFSLSMTQLVWLVCQLFIALCLSLFKPFISHSHCSITVLMEIYFQVHLQVDKNAPTSVTILWLLVDASNNVKMTEIFNKLDIPNHMLAKINKTGCCHNLTSVIKLVKTWNQWHFVSILFFMSGAKVPDQIYV